MLATGSAEAPRLWQKMATQILANVGKEWMKTRMGVLLDIDGARAHQICIIVWADNFRIMSHIKENMERMLRVLIEEASRWDLVPKPASLWWTSTYDAEEKVDIFWGTTAGCHKFPFEEKFKVLGCAMNRQGKWHDAIEERMQSANKAFWMDILIFLKKTKTFRGW